MDDPRWIAWTRELRVWWGYYNRQYCDDRLRPVGLRLVDGEAELGAWDRERREIRIAFAHLRDDPWHEVMATLRHEMAHQFADEVLLAAAEPPHGSAFRRACERLRVEARAAARGPDPVAAAADDEAARLTRVISKLLALGGSPNEHEAEAAMRKARQLMLAHNLDVVEQDRRRNFVSRPFGPTKARHQAWESTLGVILSEFFFVEVIWAPGYDAASGKRGTVLHVLGTEQNLEMAEYVHGFLGGILPRLWDEHRRARRIRGNRERMQFFDGVLSGFLQKLRDEERERSRADRALIWRGDPRLAEFFRWIHPRIRNQGGGERWLTEAFVAGREAGRNVTIHRPLAGGGRAGGGVAGHLGG
jgi:hypothetical protein